MWMMTVGIMACCGREASTHFPVFHILPDRLDDPGALHSHRDRRGRQQLVQPLSGQQLGEIEPARLDAHQHLSRLQLRLALRLHLQLHFVVAPEAREDQSPPGERLLLGCCGSAPRLLRSIRGGSSGGSWWRFIRLLLLLRLLLSWSFFRHDDQWRWPLCRFSVQINRKKNRNLPAENSHQLRCCSLQTVSPSAK